MKTLSKNLFPAHIHNLLRAMSGAGFFERSLLIGSWVMPIYEELYNAAYVLRTLDIDFAVHVAHLRKHPRADLEKLIIGLGFTDFIAAEGIQKFTSGGYEVEFITHRPGGRNIGAFPVAEWNINALPLPFISIMINFSETAELDGFIVRFPTPEAYFLHKLIIAPKRLSKAKRIKDLDQCSVLMPALDSDRLRHIVQSLRISKETMGCIRTSCAETDFPIQKLFSIPS